MLILTSPSTLHRPRCLKSETSSGYITTWLKRHQGHSAKSPVAHVDEPFIALQTDGLPLTIYIDEPLTALQTERHPPTIYIDEPLTALQLDGLPPTIHIDEPFTALQTDGLPPTIYIDEPFTALQTDGLLLTILIDELSPQHRWTSSYYLRLTSPSLHFKQTGSFLQLILTSSPLNTDGRDFTIYEPFTALQKDGLPPTIHIDKPFTALQIDGLRPIIRIDEPFTAYKSDDLFLTILIDDLSPQHRWTSSYYLRLTIPSLHFKQTGSFLQLLLTSSPDLRALHCTSNRQAPSYNSY